MGSACRLVYPVFSHVVFLLFLLFLREEGGPRYIPYPWAGEAGGAWVLLEGWGLG